MSPILAIVNFLALLIAGFIFFTLDKSFKRIFLIATLLPIAIWFIVALALYPNAPWEFVDVVMMLFRGSLLLGVLSGILACYIVTKMKQ